MHWATRHIATIVIVAVLAVSICTVGAAAQASRPRPKYSRKPSDFTIVCTLFNGPLNHAKARRPDVPVTYDAHFVIGARVERVESGQSPWTVGTLVNFVVHSPTTLLGHRFSGEQFVLTFSRFRPSSQSDKTWFAPETRYLVQAVERAPPPTTDDEESGTSWADRIAPITDRRDRLVPSARVSRPSAADR